MVREKTPPVPLSTAEGKYLTDLYTNLKSPVAYAGAGALYRQVRSDGKHQISLARIKHWLLKDDSYTQHKPARKIHPRNRVVVRGIRHIYQADLTSMANVAKYNDQTLWLLCVIDCFTKIAAVRPLKNKYPKSVKEGLRSIFKEMGKPELLNTDKGGEFIDGGVQKFLKAEGVGYFPTQNEDIKCSIVERYNRSLKAKLYKYFTHNNTWHYMDILQDMVKSMNHSYHRSIGMAPIEVNKSNEDLVWSRLYGKPFDMRGELKEKPLKVGDVVRLKLTKDKFEKSHTPNWSAELYKVSQLIPKRPFPVYNVADLNGEDLVGTFYRFELQKVDIDPDSYHFKIEKVIQKKKIQGVPSALVKYKNYSAKFNKWIPQSWLTNY